MKFIKRLIEAWKIVSLKLSYDEEAADPNFWTKEDLLWLGSALAHPSGQKFLRRLNNKVFQSAVDATKRTLNPRYHCGIARGMALLKADIDLDFMTALSLAGAQSGKSEPTEEERDADELEKLLSQVL